MVSWLLCSNVSGTALATSLESCLGQTFQDFEIVVVANGSHATDVFEQACEFRQKDARIVPTITQVRHLNFSLALGLHLCRGAYVARLDADDVAYPERLAAQIEYLQTNPEISVLGSAYNVIDATGAIESTVQLPTKHEEIARRLVHSNPLCHPAVTFRRQSAIDAGGYLGGIHAEDYDLWCRMSRLPRMRFANLGTALTGYRASPNGAARRSRSAYASVAATQFGNFALGMGAQWGMAALMSVLKAGLRSKRA